MRFYLHLPHLVVLLHTLVVYRYKVVIEDNHLRIQLDSWVIHTLTDML